MKKLLAPILKERMLEVLAQAPMFSCDDNIMPFLVTLGDARFYLYVKNISSAYFSKSPDITRVQLPEKGVIFNNIIQSNFPFVMLGYDYPNDVVVSWNPAELKIRLNTSKNISLYSRQSFQNEVGHDEFKCLYLTNGGKVVMFKRHNLTYFLLHLSDWYPLEKKGKVGDKITINRDNVTNGKLTKITDNTIISKIKPLLLNYHIFEAVSIVMQYYADQYPNMTLKDWSPLVRQLKDEFIQEP